MKAPVLLLWTFLLVVLGLSLARPHAMLSPAALTTAHAELERDCLACHDLGRGVPDAHCTKCHEVARIGLFTSKGAPIAKPNVKASFHQRLKETRCLACHTEHPGSRGQAAHAGFTHDMLSPADRGDCASCHEPPGDALHRGVTGSCASCHTTERWKPATFAHEKYWPLDRAHTATCVTCHPGNVFEKYTCYGCHEHSPARLAHEHDEVRGPIDDCVRCHKSANDREGGEHGEGGGHGEGGHEGRGRERGGDDD